MSHAYLDTLNEGQRAAVEYCDGSQLVIAGAGSGKTRVLTCKIAYLLELGLPPWSIMALTFTNKAAKEMRERIEVMVGSDARRLIMGTFHSVFARILRAEAPLVGYNANYTIYDDADSRSVISSIIKEMELDSQVYKPALVQNVISSAKNQTIDARTYSLDTLATRRDSEEGRPSLSKIYTRYDERLRRSNAMDFDDLLLLTYQLFRDNDEVRQRYASRFKYILVDEYQDTNRVQHLIVSQLAETNHRICAVGDDAQSIYAFRGADIDNILNFNNALSDSRLFRLEQNYRSTQFIVDAANSLIKKNKRQIDKHVYSQNSHGEPISIIETASDDEEVVVVRKELQRIKKAEGEPYSDFAILYRTHAQSRKMEEEFRKYAIPYIIYGGLGFYQHKEIKDMIAYFRLIVNHSDDEAFRRIVNYPARGIGNTTLSRVAEAAMKASVSLFDVALQPEHYVSGISKSTANKLKAFASMIESLSDLSQTLAADSLSKKLLDVSGIKSELGNSTDEDSETRRENIEELIGSINDFVVRQKEQDHEDETTLEYYLQEVSLMTDADRNQDTTDCVRLMTIHAAKGLEFSTVFVVGMEENLFPSDKSLLSAKALEEERRLCYVAITRAKLHCILTYAQTRYLYGRFSFSTPSRFLTDIDKQYVKRIGTSTPFNRRMQPSKSHRENIFEGRHRKEGLAPSPIGMRRMDSKPQMADEEPRSDSLTTRSGTVHIGTRIAHNRFGHGRVSLIEGVGENAKITVDFENMGQRKLLVKFAQFTIEKE